MLIGYSMPPVSAIALGAGAGAGQAWLTADGGAACYDGKPARRARLQWRTGAPALTDYVQVLLTIPATPLRVCALLGLKSVPVGAQVQLYGKRAGDASASWGFGGQNTGTVQRFADGSYGVWIVLPAGAEAVTQVAFRLVNNAGGATWADAATTVDIGELVAMPAVEALITRDWTLQEPGSTTRLERTRGAQINAVAGSDYRRLAFSMEPSGVDVVRGGALANGMDWYALRAALAGGARAALIPRWRTVDGDPDAEAVNATAVYGVAVARGDIAHLGGDIYGWSLGVEEIPSG